VAQLLEKLADVGANLCRVCVGELRFQFLDDLAESALAVAALQDLTACALQLDCAFGKKDYADFFGAGLLLGTPAATGGQARLTVVFGRGHASGVSRSVVRCTRKQVPRLRIAIDKANRNTPLGMTGFDVAIGEADRDAALGMTRFEIAIGSPVRPAALGMTRFLASC
jgi:hypothetical protein